MQTYNAFQSNNFHLTLNGHLIRNNTFQDKISFVAEFQLNPKTQFRKQYINGKTGNLRTINQYYIQIHIRQELPTSMLNLEALRHGLFTHLHQQPSSHEI
jgi:hypothetical protein